MPIWPPLIRSLQLRPLRTHSRSSGELPLRRMEIFIRERRGDQLDAIGDRYVDLATVLAAAGRHDEARANIDLAVEQYRLKENLASARRAEELRATF